MQTQVECLNAIKTSLDKFSESVRIYSSVIKEDIKIRKKEHKLRYLKLKVQYPTIDFSSSDNESETG